MVAVLALFRLCCNDVAFFLTDTTLLLKTTGPLVIIGVLWFKPLFQFVRGDVKHSAAAQDATVWSMLLLELCLPSVSTQISESFMCNTFPGEGKFLRAQVPCSCSPLKCNSGA